MIDPGVITLFIGIGIFCAISWVLWSWMDRAGEKDRREAYKPPVQ